MWDFVCCVIGVLRLSKGEERKWKGKRGGLWRIGRWEQWYF